MSGQDVTRGSLTDVPGITVGHATEERARTGCTVVLVGTGSVAGVDVVMRLRSVHVRDVLLCWSVPVPSRV